MSLPQIIQTVEVPWSSATTPQSAAAFDASAGDLLVACSMIYAYQTVTLSDNSSLVWVLQTETTDNRNPHIYMWTTLLTSDVSGCIVTIARVGSTGYNYGAMVLTIRGSGGSGATNSASAGVTPAAPAMSLTTTAEHSAILVAVADGTAADGSSRVWRTGAGGLTELTYFRGTPWTVYLGWHDDVTLVAAVTLGLTTPTMLAAISAIEILSGSDPVLPEQTDIITNLHAR